MSANERILMTTFIIVVAVILLATLLYSAGSFVAKQECQAFGFEWGLLVLYPVFQIECEYQRRVPLREIVPPIEQGDINNQGV